MYSVKRYSKTILLYSWTNPEFKSMNILFLNLMRFNDHNTDSFPVLFQPSETSNHFVSIIFFINKKLYKNTFIPFRLVNPIFKLEVQIMMIMSSRST